MKRKVEREGDIRRLVIKVGTANLCDASGRLSQGIFYALVFQITSLMRRGIEVIIVSSGAVKAGQEKMNGLGMDTSLLHKKDLAGIGARHLMNMWGQEFFTCNMEVGQIWVTFSNWKNRGEKKSIKSSLLSYLKSGMVVPIVNEADVISDREIRLMEKGFSENDRLARMIAFLVDADAILFLTDKGGIYTADPQKNCEAKLYAEIDAWEDPQLIGISGDCSKIGTGGMMAKWREASLCAKKGMRVAIAGNGRDEIFRFVNGENVGTRVGTKTIFKV